MQTLESYVRQKYHITARQWQEYLLEADHKGLSLGKVLVNRGLLSEDELLSFLSRQLDMPLVDVSAEEIDAETTRKIPSKFAIHYHVMPLRRENGILRMAVSNPLDVLALDEIRLFLNQDIEFVIARGPDILDAIRKFYGLGAETLDQMAETAPTKGQGTGMHSPENKDISDQASDPSVIKFLNQVMVDAVKQRATDIHFEPFEDALRIRYRIDGVLYEVASPGTIKQFQASIASRIKVMAGLDIAEKRRPQDGRVEIKIAESMYDLRISVMPTPYGESIGIRILPRTVSGIGLEHVGLDKQDLALMEQLIAKTTGIILVTGPTGSGKTTTLYGCLSRINSSERKILTIEDPIEYQLKGITQMQVDPKIGFTFANALRSMLRHDPDVMMVGEIRDTDTAELAVRTALTGHLVFSTLHTNDAAGGVARLLDMGIDAFLVSSSVNLIIAQRLVRLICPHCKTACSPQEAMLRQFPAAAPGTVFYRGTGCDQCRATGYKERSGIFEMLVISDEIRAMILKKLPSHVIKEAAVKEGMRSLKTAGWEKVVSGQTTVEEVLRVIQES